MGDIVDESSLPAGTEIADLADILSIKDVETDLPSYKGRIIFRGDIPKVVLPDGRLQGVAENVDCWAPTAADHAGVRLVLAHALINGNDTFSCDMDTAYLQADAGGRETYVRLHGLLAKSLPDDLKAERAKHWKPVHKLIKAL